MGTLATALVSVKKYSKTTNCSCNSLGLGQKICSFFSPSFLILQWRGCLRQAKSALKSSAVEVMGGPTPHRAPHLPESPASITMSALLQNLLFHPLVAPDVPSLVAPSSAQKTRPLLTGRCKGFRARMVFARKPKWKSTTFQHRL